MSTGCANPGGSQPSTGRAEATVPSAGRAIGDITTRTFNKVAGNSVVAVLTLVVEALSFPRRPPDHCGIGE